MTIKRKPNLEYDKDEFTLHLTPKSKILFVFFRTIHKDCATAKKFEKIWKFGYKQWQKFCQNDRKSIGLPP